MTTQKYFVVFNPSKILLYFYWIQKCFVVFMFMKCIYFIRNIVVFLMHIVLGVELGKKFFVLVELCFWFRINLILKSLFFITFLKYYLAGFLVKISSFSHSVKPFRSFPLLLADNSPLCKDSPSHSQSVDFYPKYIVIYCLKTLFCWNLVEIHLGKLLCKEICMNETKTKSELPFVNFS